MAVGGIRRCGVRGNCFGEEMTVVISEHAARLKRALAQLNKSQSSGKPPKLYPVLEKK